MSTTTMRRAVHAESETSEETRRRLMAAAMRSVARYGLEKTSLNDIAREAGCVRQTVYNHFKNADAVILAALEEASKDFVARLLVVIAKETTPGDRVIEAMMFCLEGLPREPFLRFVAVPEFAPLANLSVFTSGPSLEVVRMIAGACLAPDPTLSRCTDELAEMMTRLLLSMLTLEGPSRRTPDETRAFLRRWLLPLPSCA